MGRGISTRMTPPRHTSRRNICRSASAARDIMSLVRLASRRRSRSGWPGGKSFAGRRVTTQRDGALYGEEGMRKLALMVGAATAVAATISTQGCSVLGRAAFKEPVVNLSSVSVRGVGLTGGSLDVVLNVYNPNHYRLDATQLNYRVQMANDSIVVASGTLQDRFTVNEGDSSKVTIPVDFTYSG